MSVHVLVVERYTCPWCDTVVVNIVGGGAMTVFEHHLDAHYAAQLGMPGPAQARPPLPRRYRPVRMRSQSA